MVVNSLCHQQDTASCAKLPNGCELSGGGSLPQMPFRRRPFLASLASDAESQVRSSELLGRPLGRPDQCRMASEHQQGNAKYQWGKEDERR